MQLQTCITEKKKMYISERYPIKMVPRIPKGRRSHGKYFAASEFRNEKNRKIKEKIGYGKNE